MILTVKTFQWPKDSSRPYSTLIDVMNASLVYNQTGDNVWTDWMPMMKVSKRYTAQR